MSTAAVMCDHANVRWLHGEIVQDCVECSAEGNPCGAIVCIACGADVEPSTERHFQQLTDGA